MSAHGQPFQSHGFNTSIDLVRRQTYSVPSLAGHKRRLGSPSGDPPSKTSISGVSHSLNQPNPSHHQAPSTSRPVDFTRPSVGLSRGRLVASEIRPVTAAAEDHHQVAEEQPPPPSSQNPLLSLKDPRYGLPPSLVANFAALGVTSIYGWQASCLLANGLLTGERHLVYTAPTGGGKSLVADVLMLKRIIENPSKKAILVLPYVALVQEKLKWLRRIVQDVEKHVPDDQDGDTKPAYKRWKKEQKSIRVTGYFGGNRTTASWADTDIAVCTIEKVCWIRSLSISLLTVSGQLVDQYCHRRMQYWRSRRRCFGRAAYA